MDERDQDPFFAGGEETVGGGEECGDVFHRPRMGSDYFIRCDGEFANAFAGGVVDSVGDSGGDTDDADLADTATAHGIDVRVGLVDEVDVKVVDVGVGADGVVGEVGVDDAAVVEVGFFHEGHADAHGNAAEDLAARSLGIDDAAVVDGGDDAGDADAAEGFVDGDFDEVAAEGLEGVLSSLDAGEGGGGGFEFVWFGGGDEFAEIVAAVGIGFAGEVAVDEVDFVGFQALERGFGFGVGEIE